MYKNILVPVDLGHEERVKPMIEAAKLLGGGTARIILTHVIEEVPAYVAAQLPEGVMINSQKKVEESLKGIAERIGANVEIDVHSGHAANTILEIADEKGIDCIVIASHKPGWEDFLIGSTAARVVRHAKCAVHVLR